MQVKTMKEMIPAGESVLNGRVTRAIAKQMREKGWQRKRMRWEGKVQWCWIKEPLQK